MPYEPTTLGELTERYYRRHVTDVAAELGIRERDLAAYIAVHGPVDIHPPVHSMGTTWQAAA